MTVYRLIELMTSACAPSATFGDVTLWWSEARNQLYMSKEKPRGVADAEDLRYAHYGAEVRQAQEKKP